MLGSEDAVCRMAATTVAAVCCLLIGMARADEPPVHLCHPIDHVPTLTDLEARASSDLMGPFIASDNATVAEPATRAAAFWDLSSFYVVVECDEPAMESLVGSENARGPEVFGGDTVEVFLATTPEATSYYHFVATPRGGQWAEGVRVQGWAPQWGAAIERLKDRWVAVFAVGWGCVGGLPKSSDVLRLNVTRQRLTGGSRDLSAWSPTGTSFHQPDRFGRVGLWESPTQVIREGILDAFEAQAADLLRRADRFKSVAGKVRQTVAASREHLKRARDVAERGEVTLDDLPGLLAEADKAREGLGTADELVHAGEVAERMAALAQPGQEALVYSVPAITNRKVLPIPEPPEDVSQTLNIAACRGEFEPCSFVVYPLQGDLTVSVHATPLVGKGGTISCGAVDVRAVKCWFQAGAYQDFPQNWGVRLLTPELLLHDDDLVRVDLESKQNYVKLSFDDGTTRWLWISSDETTPEEEDKSVEAMPISDARHLLPVTLPAQRAKRFWVTVRVPDDAEAGTYAGRIELTAGDRPIASLPVTLEVLPFDLEPNPLESSIYFHWGIELDTEGNGSVSHRRRSVRQYEWELRDLVEHGIDNPTVGVPFDTGLLPLVLELRRKAGMRNDNLYYLIESAEQPSRKIPEIIRVAREHGVKSVHLYGRDEAQGEQLRAQREVWEKLHDLGGKVFVAGFAGSFEIVGDVQDVYVRAGWPSRDEARKWHSKGHRIFCYGNPQSGIEQPETYRRNYGLLLYRNEYDGGMTYIYYGDWNDFNIRPWRQHNFIYPTVDGGIDTVQWEGYREGIDDLRYVATLVKAIEAAEHAGRTAETDEARKFIDGMDVSGDLYALRAEIVTRIRRLLGR